MLDVGSDIAGPQWVFGQSRYALLDDGRIVLAFGRAGADRLAVLSPDGDLRELDVPYATFRYVTAQGTAVACLAGSPSSEAVVLHVDVDSGDASRCSARRGTSAWTPPGSRSPSTSRSRRRTAAPASPSPTRWSTRRPTRRSPLPRGISRR